MPRTHRIAAEGITAVIKAAGAELTSLRDSEGRELLWQAGPEWPRHAPVLFPIVGALAGNRLHHAGRDYPLTQHGFARDADFELVEGDAESAHFRLSDSPATRASYPFPFVLELLYAARESTLSVTVRVTNPGREPLPCGVGVHPGFVWPLVPEAAKTDHAIDFEHAETGEILSVVAGGLLGPAKPSSPLSSRRLPLSPDLFAKDALVMPGVASRSVRYVATDADGRVLKAITVSWEGFKDLGIWSKPGGADFVCIEPWYGMASPDGWDGAFAEKPGILVLEAGATRDFVWTVTL